MHLSKALRAGLHKLAEERCPNAMKRSSRFTEAVVLSFKASWTMDDA
jgi:hypothetical protein